MACHSGPYDCHFGKNDHDINETFISPYIILCHLIDKVNSIKASGLSVVCSLGSSESWISSALTWIEPSTTMYFPV